MLAWAGVGLRAEPVSEQTYRAVNQLRWRCRNSGQRIRPNKYQRCLIVLRQILPADKSGHGTSTNGTEA